MQSRADSNGLRTLQLVCPFFTGAKKQASHLFLDTSERRFGCVGVDDHDEIESRVRNFRLGTDRFAKAAFGAISLGAIPDLLRRSDPHFSGAGKGDHFGQGTTGSTTFGEDPFEPRFVGAF